MNAAKVLKDKLTSSDEPSSPNSPPPELDGTAKPRRLVVAAGPSYAAHSHIPVPVNSPTPIVIHSRSMLVLVHVRIKTFNGLPAHTSRPTSAYFDAPGRAKDLYSVGFSFIPKRAIAAHALVWGNDFDHPVAKYLPPGFNAAFRIVKEFVDPGLVCDAYADRPYVLGPALSCWFALRVGERVDLDAVGRCLKEAGEGERVKEWSGEEGHEEKKENRVLLLRKIGEGYAGPRVEDGEVQEMLGLFPEKLRDGDIAIEEGADGDEAVQIREQLGIPDDFQKRRKFFLKDENRQGFVFEKGRVYSGDFHNPYIDFDEGKLKLPGFSLNVLRFVGDKTHTLRYVCKDKDTDEVMFCVTLSMLFNQDVQKAEAAEKEGLKSSSRTES